MNTPKQTQLNQTNTTRLIPSKYSDGGESVLTRISDDLDHLNVIFELDGATNDRLVAESDRAAGVAAAELVYGSPHYRIVNAAFCHPSPTGGRFNGPERGAWYAGFSRQTAMAEVVFHKSLALAEINLFEDSVTYDAYHADFTALFHDIRDSLEFSNCLLPDDYRPAQLLAESLLADGSNGIIFPSVRDAGGECIACFRPILVNNVRKRDTWRLTWDGSDTPTIEKE